MVAKKGFTLIELLVVIAIIALLLSVIVPSLKIAKERTMDTICMSNIKQYNVAMVMYCNENDSLFANGEDWIFRNFINGVGFPAAPHVFGCVWHDASMTPDGTVIGYLGDNGVALCPLFAKISPSRCICVNGSTTHNPAIPIVPQFNFTLNAFLGTYRTRPTYKDQATKITIVKSPSQVISFGEENPFEIPAGSRPNLSVAARGTLNDCLLWPLDPGTAKNTINGLPQKKYTSFSSVSFNDSFGSFHRAKDTSRYLGVSDAVFVDGSVKWVTPEDTLKYTWPF